MGKGVKIALVCLEFAVCIAAGYLLGEIVSIDSNKASGTGIATNGGITSSGSSSSDKISSSGPISSVEHTSSSDAKALTETISPVSTIPVVSVGDNAPVRLKNGTYSYKVQATVESGDSLVYILFADEACNAEIQRSSDGSFKGVQPTETGIYYLCVQNFVTKECSPVIPVKGFEKPKLIMYQKITKEELNNIINVAKSYTAAPKGFSHRMSPSFKIIVNAAKAGDGNVSTIDEICSRVMFEE
jgi:hypothetical protein